MAGRDVICLKCKAMYDSQKIKNLRCPNCDAVVSEVSAQEDFPKSMAGAGATSLGARNVDARISRTSSGDSFLANLFDFKFRNFVTTQVAGVMFLLCTVLVTLTVLWQVLGILSSLGDADASQAFTKLAMACYFLLSGFIAIVLIRLVLESLVALVKVAQNTSK